MKTIHATLTAFFILSLNLLPQSSASFPKDSDTPKVNINYISSANEFGFRLLKTLASHDPAKNVFISPASIFIALSMTGDGAATGTEESIRTALQLKEFNTNEINESNAQLLKSLTLPDSSVELSIANSLWLNRPFILRPEFTYDCRQYYSAETYEKDFSDANTTNELNKWVKDKTHGKIEKILDHLFQTDVLVILDAIYFYGKWTFPFDSSRTEKKPFFALDGSEKQYPRMYQFKTFDYYDHSEFQAVSIPYGKRYSMYVFLPRERSGLPRFLRELDKMNWDRWMSRLSPREGTIGMPRFKIEYFASLVDVLKSLGMGIAFSAEADFSRMTQSSVCISDVVHKTYLEVNEQGTKAAAVTAIKISAISGAVTNPPKPFEMIIDHPFFCVIRDNTTGLVLFAGAIFDPTSD